MGAVVDDYAARRTSTAVMDAPTLFDRQHESRLKVIISAAEQAFRGLRDLPLGWRVEALNQLRMALHHESPFHAEPVDCVIWMPVERVISNDYNPNTVAPARNAITRTFHSDGWIHTTDRVLATR